MNLSEIINELKKWSESGEKITNNQTLLICKVPHIASEAWFHRIYKGLSENEIVDLETELKKPLPNHLRKFLKTANGMNIFSDSISIWGRRTSYARKGEDAYQPYDLLDLNKELGNEMSSKWLAFGSYSWDGSMMYYDVTSDDNKVFICERDSTNKIKIWDNIYLWLAEEIERLSKMYDDKGIELDEDAPTTPMY